MITINSVTAFSDNYVWIISHSSHTGVYIVDPGEAGPVLNYLQSRKLSLEGIFITHSHNDHTGGVEHLLSHYPAPVYGPDHSAIPWVSEPLSGGSTPLLWQKYPVKVLETPGHLPEQISFLVMDGEKGLLFCGDVLFSAGCGRILLGTPDEMKGSLDSLKALPDTTLVYPAHEYTSANLKFALAVEPGNQNMLQRQQEVTELNARGESSLPTTIGLEQQINPFFRCGEPRVIQQIENRLGRPLKDELAVFTEMRRWKDSFR